MIENLRTKRAGETRTGWISFKDRLDASLEEEVSSATVVERRTADLTITVISAEDDRVTFTVSGGTAGQDYTVIADAVTSEGQTLQRSLTFNVI